MVNYNDLMSLIEQQKDISYPENKFCRYNHIEVVFVEKDHAITRLKVCDESLNWAEQVHGGLLFAMGDTTGGNACRTDGRLYVTQSASFNYISNTSKGHIVLADAKVFKRGRSIVVLDIEFVDDTNKCLAKGTYNFFCVKQNQ